MRNTSALLAIVGLLLAVAEAPFIHMHGGARHVRGAGVYVEEAVIHVHLPSAKRVSLPGESHCTGMAAGHGKEEYPTLFSANQPDPDGPVVDNSPAWLPLPDAASGQVRAFDQASSIDPRVTGPPSLRAPPTLL